MLLQRIRDTTLDDAMWKAAVKDIKNGGYQEIHRLEREIKDEKKSQDNIIASLSAISNEKMVQRAQARFEASERHIAGTTTPGLSQAEAAAAGLLASASSIGAHH